MALCRSSPGAMHGTGAPALHAPALSDLSGFLSNVSHQIAALQYEMNQIKNHTGISFPEFNPDVHFAESLANHINESPKQSMMGRTSGYVPSLLHSPRASVGISSKMVAESESNTLPAAAVALKASFAPEVGNRTPSPGSSIPSEPNACADTPPSQGISERPFSAGGMGATTRPVSGASVRSARPGSTRNIIVAAGDQAQILSLTQMVEQFEERVEDRLEEMEAKLAASVDQAEIPHAMQKQVSTLEREVALLRSGVDNSSSSAEEATKCTAALVTELAETRADMQASITVLQQQVDPHAQKESEKRVAEASASVEGMAQAHAQLQARMKEIEGGAERMRGEHRALSAQITALERQRGELAATMRKVEKVAKVELDEATGALQAQITATVDANKQSEETLQTLEERSVAWDSLCDRIDADAATAAAAREALKDAFAQEASALAAHLSNSDEKVKALTLRFNEAMEEVDRLSSHKQDSVSAITMDMVNRRVAAGIDDATERHRHAERQLATMQASIEELIVSKADKGDIATAAKLKSGLTEIQQKAADAIQEGIKEVKMLLTSKAEGHLLRDIEKEVARRFSSLEGALLKGLQTVSDKAAGALELKLPVAEYDRFRGTVTARLTDINKMLRELLPTARALGASPNRTTCLSCDQRVRSNGDIMHALHGSGSVAEDFPMREQLARAAEPQALPRTAPVGGRKPISSIDPIGASHNAWLASKSRNFASLHTNQKLSKRQQPATAGQLSTASPSKSRPNTTPFNSSAPTAARDAHRGWTTSHDTVLE